VIGLALGSGSARGWAHIAVIRELERLGIRPDIICGTSIGAVVGAAYAAGELERFEVWVSRLKLGSVLGFLDIGLNGGLLKGERLIEFFKKEFVDRPIEALNRRYAAVATDLMTGSEIWLRDGSTTDALRASAAIPGLFSPVIRDGRLLADGGMVNPVPVSLARAMGADLVIAVDLNADLLASHRRALTQSETPTESQRNWLESSEAGLRMPSMIDVVTASLHVMQARITRSRMAGEPPDLLITPRLAQMGMLDFHRAEPAFNAGRDAVRHAWSQLHSLGLVRSNRPQ
jgi:NTE family protein